MILNHDFAYVKISGDNSNKVVKIISNDENFEITFEDGTIKTNDDFDLKQLEADQKIYEATKNETI